MAKPHATTDRDVIYINDPDSTISGNITANDTADSGEPIYLRSLNGTSVGAKQGLQQETTIEGTYGTFVVKPNGDYSYKLHADIDPSSIPADGLTEKVGYKISSSGGTDYDYLYITIKPPHSKPVADDQTAVVIDGAVSGDLTSSDILSVSRAGAENTATANLHDYNLSFVQPDGSTVIDGQYGNLHIERDGSYTYTLDAGLSFDVEVSETFQFRIYDDAFGEFANNLTTDVGILTISIPPTDLV